MAKKQTVDIGNRLKKLRGTVPQSTVAQYAGITVPVYSRYETGLSEPSLYTVSKLAEFFRVSVDYLINGDVEPVEKITEEKTGLSSGAINYLKKLASYCEEQEVPNPINELITKVEFQNGISEILVSMLLLLNHKQGLTIEDIGKLVHRLNRSHILNGGNIEGYQGVFFELARLHAEDAKSCIGKAIDKIRTEVWNNGEC